MKSSTRGMTAVLANAVYFQGKWQTPFTVIMRVDHPFFCAIRDNVTGTVLFAGLIRDPN